jgi:hypothetical protein
LRPIARQYIEKAHDLFAKPPTLWRIMRSRDQQKWTPVLRPIARQYIEKAAIIAFAVRNGAHFGAVIRP